MKRMLFLICYLTFSGLVQAQKNENVRFYYVLQNPKMFGTDSARAWFEIAGMKDKVVQAKINDTLRKSFYATTNFRDNGPVRGGVGWTPTPPFHTDYTFNNMSTYGHGWVRFKDRDSLLRLTEADGYYGSGVNLIGFTTAIAQGKIAYIYIQCGSSYRPSTPNEFTFSLITGNCLPNKFYIRLDPTKKDSLENLLFRGIVYEPYPKPVGCHDCKFVRAEPLSDSVVIAAKDLIAWFDHSEQHILLISQNFRISCLMGNNEERTHTTSNYLRIQESIPFLRYDEWTAVQEIYK